MPTHCFNKQSSAEVARGLLVACVAAALVCRAVCGQEAVNLAVAATTKQTATINFARDVQPILASKCIRCHGHETREAGLRLDDRNVASSKLESGNCAIVPGK